MIFLMNVLLIALIYGFIIFLLMLWNKEDI